MYILEKEFFLKTSILCEDNVLFQNDRDTWKHSSDITPCLFFIIDTNEHPQETENNNNKKQDTDNNEE